MRIVQLSKERVLELQQIFQEECGKKLFYKEAHEAAHNLVGIFDLLLKIDIRQNPQNYIQKEKTNDK